MSPFKRILCIVVDGVGVGETPDAAGFDNAGSDSLGNTARHVGGLRLPLMQRMGLGNIVPISGVLPADHPTAHFGRLRPASVGKDSTTGHWELMGCVVREPLPTYPAGLPSGVLAAIEEAIGRRVIGNRAARGTDIIAELGAEHVQRGSPIVFTSPGSVFQIAAHRDVIPVDALYGICKIARSILTPPHGVARVIARPFDGEPGGFYRMAERKDFSLPPTGRTVLDGLAERGRTVLGIGKIGDLFAQRGITESIATKNNRDGMAQTLAAAADRRWDMVFANLVDFDTMWGHRNDPRAYALGLEEFDAFLIGLLKALDDGTLLIVTSDHGNDPTTGNTDHSREYVPLLAFHHGGQEGTDLGTRETLSDVASTIAENFDVGMFEGSSFLGRLRS